MNVHKDRNIIDTHLKHFHTVLFKIEDYINDLEFNKYCGLINKDLKFIIHTLADIYFLALDQGEETKEIEYEKDLTAIIKAIDRIK